MSSDKEILALEDKRCAAMCGGDFAALEAMIESFHAQGSKPPVQSGEAEPPAPTGKEDEA